MKYVKFYSPVVLLLNILYILLSDTITFHNLPIPTIQIWTILILIPLAFDYYNLNFRGSDRKITYYEVILLTLSLLSSLFVLFDFNVSSPFVTIFGLIIAVLFLIYLSVVIYKYMQENNKLPRFIIFLSLYLGVFAIHMINKFFLAFTFVLPNYLELFSELILFVIYVYLLKIYFVKSRVLSVVSIIVSIAFTILFYALIEVLKLSFVSLVLKIIFLQVFDLGGFSTAIFGLQSILYLNIYLAISFGILLLATKKYQEFYIGLTGLNLFYPPLFFIRIVLWLNLLRTRKMEAL